MPSGKFKGTEEERIEWLARKVVKVAKKHHPDFVVIEGHSFASKGRGVSILHELHGVIKNRLQRNGILFLLVAPDTAKKHFTGNGHATKEEMVEAAQEYDPDIINDNVADALACAHWGNVMPRTEFLERLAKRGIFPESP